MYRILKTLCVLPWLAGCGSSAWTSASPQWHAQSRNVVRHDFAWRLSGDRQVAPLQVFDDGAQTWLQFRAGQVLPAIFASTDSGELPVPYTHREPYVVLAGKWPSLVMRGGQLQAQADYLGSTGQIPRASHVPPATVPLPAIVDAATGPQGRNIIAATHGRRQHGGDSAPGSAPGFAPGLGSGFVPHSALSSAPNSAASATGIAGRRATAALTGASTMAVPPEYRAGPADENMRRVLARWAAASGWTFGPEHWAVDVDIPLAGGADFGVDFKKAVRELMAATELGERPLQPCFYTNRVLRVVPFAQACDRSAARPGSAS
jgi:hypothetical protein